MESIQWVSMMTCILALILIVDLMRRGRYPNLYLWPVLFLVINIVVFYVARLLELHVPFVTFNDNIRVFTTWSSILRLQSSLTILAYAIILGNYDIKWINFVGRKWNQLLLLLKN
jgi:hypothetical protein